MHPTARDLIAIRAVACWIAAAASVLTAGRAAADDAAPKAEAAKADLPKIDAEVRLRGSTGTGLGQIAPGYESKQIGWFQRSRLGVQFDRGDLGSYVQVQSSSAFGAAQPGADPVALGLQQGWLRARVAALGEAWIEAGRLAMEYGAARQIGRYDFDPIGQAFDGVRGHVAVQKRLMIDALAVKLRRAAGQPDQERNLTGVYLTGRPSDAFAADLYFLYLSDGSQAELARLLTMGARVDTGPVPWLAADLEAAVQVGSITKADVRDPQDHLAWMAAGKAWLQGKLGAEMGLGVLGQAFSADSDDRDRTRRAWRPLYPSRDRLLGLMQLFDASNLQQFGAAWRVSLPALDGQLRAELDWRSNRAVASGPLPGLGGGAMTGGATSGSGGWQDLGWQADLRLSWQAARNGSELLAAAGLFDPSASLVRDRGTRRATVVLLQWTAGF